MAGSAPDRLGWGFMQGENEAPDLGPLQLAQGWGTGGQVAWVCTATWGARLSPAISSGL